MTEIQTGLIKGYRGTDGDVEPVEFECEVFGWPNKTTDGEMMFFNTHFRTEKEAWDSINRSWEAGVSLDANALQNARNDVAKWEKILADDVLKAQESKVKYEEWRTRNEQDV